MAIEVKTNGSSPLLQVKSAVPSSTVVNVEPDSGYDGLSYVNIQGDSNLQPTNIKYGVTIFGVSGNYKISNQWFYNTSTFSTTGSTTTTFDVGQGVYSIASVTECSFYIDLSGQYTSMNGNIISCISKGNQGILFYYNSGYSGTLSFGGTPIAQVSSNRYIIITLPKVAIQSYFAAATYYFYFCCSVS